MSDSAKPELDITKTHVVHEFKHGSPLLSCRFHPSDEAIFFGAQDNAVWRWNWSENKEKVVGFAAHDSWVRSIAFSKDGETLLTGGYDGRLMWWPARDAEPKPLRTVDAHEGWIRAIDVSPDGQIVGTVGNDHLVKLWSVDDGSLLQELSGHECHVYNLAFHPAGMALVSGDLKAQLIHWELPAGKEVRRMKAEPLYKYDGGFRADIGGFRGLTFDAHGQRLAGSGIMNVTNAFAGVGNPAVVELDWESGEQKIVHESKAKHKGVAWNAAFHPSAEITAAVCGGSSGGYLLFWKPDGKEELHQLKFPNTGRDMDLRYDEVHVATAHYDRRIRISRMTA
jgi:WD40 repeat protein